MTATRFLTTCLFVALVLVGRAAQAQTAAYAGGGVAYFECCGSTGFAGGGADLVSRIGVGGGSEAGVFVDESGGVLAGVTLHAIVQPRPRKDRGFVPFAAIGIGGFLGPEISATAWHIGGGFNSWGRERLGTRLEVRVYADTGHYVRDRIIVVRGAVTFR